MELIGAWQVWWLPSLHGIEGPSSCSCPKIGWSFRLVDSSDILGHHLTILANQNQCVWSRKHIDFNLSKAESLNTAWMKSFPPFQTSSKNNIPKTEGLHDRGPITLFSPTPKSFKRVTATARCFFQDTLKLHREPLWPTPRSVSPCLSWSGAESVVLVVFGTALF